MRQKEDSSHTSFKFPKKERICSPVVIESLFAKRQSVFCYPFKCYYDFAPASETVCCNTFAVSVPKKRFKHAVQRNLVKRRTREAYRLNKHILDALNAESGKFASLFFVFVSNDIPDFNSFNDKIIEILNRLVSDNLHRQCYEKS